jgi:protoporphyrinogen oxidase
MKKIAIIGAGPAGLTAAYELVKEINMRTVVFEATSAIGGISQTVRYKGHRMDIGGHRLFSKNKQVMDWWENIMPLQGKPAFDDILLNEQEKPFAVAGPDPEKKDRVMLFRRRVSRIFFLRKFFDYPISLKWETFANMGVWRTMKAGVDYVITKIHKRPNNSLENFYINRFGKTLYRLFFEDYTEKVWGIHPARLGADWGSQRVKEISVSAVLKNMLVRKFASGRNVKETETSLIEQFIYPKYGPGQLWETVADEIRQSSGEIHMQSEVKKIHITGNRVVSIDYKKEGQLFNEPCDYLLSSMPIKDIIAAMDGIDIPEDVKRIAQALPYRDFITVGLLVKKLKIRNKTKIKTYDNRIPDTWIYIQERDVKIGRLQIFNNWSPYMVEDYKNTVWMGLEYFCTEDDEMWKMNEEDFIRMAIDELEKIDVIDKREVLDAVQVKVKKAYPSYFGTYYELDKVKSFLDQIENLFCIGRNGQHRYNNMDHSMLTAMEAVNNIKENKTTKTNVWAVNADVSYLETKS